MNRLKWKFKGGMSWVASELHITVFVVLALTIGLVFIYSKGPFTGPDMYDAHYKAALATATGQSFNNVPSSSTQGSKRVIRGDEDYFWSGGGKCVDITLVSAQLISPLDANDQDECIKEYDKNLSSETVVSKAIIVYPPLGYLPQAAGLLVGIGGGMEPIYGQTLARVFNLLVYILLVAVSIKLVPIGRWLLVVLGLLPTSLFLASSLSPDSLNIAWSFVFIAYVARLYHGGVKISTRQIGILGVLGFGLFMLKVAYAPLLLLVLGLDERVMKRLLRWLFVTLVAIIGSIVYLVWSANWGTMVIDVDAAANLSAILYNLPAAIGGVLINVLFTPYRVFESNQSLYVFLALIICWMIVSRVRTVRPVLVDDLLDLLNKYKLQVFGVIAAVGSLGLTYAALLLTWTNIAEYGFLDIQGFQGRYTLPLLPLLLLAYYLPHRAETKVVSSHRSTVKSNTRGARGVNR